MKGKGNKQRNKSIPQDNETLNDERFNQVFTDPRFMTVPQKIKKVEIDDRFKSVLTNRKFNIVAKVDKYGRRVDKEDKSMQQFYKIKNDGKKSND